MGHDGTFATPPDTKKNMGKGDFLTPKAIATRIKSKGLQRLRWFCQVCQKQCRDENGFKCHTASESHQRQMLIVANNPDAFINSYSNQFEKGFLDILRLRHSTKRMKANMVYNEYIQDKAHVHMNATQWTTLSGFVQYLGKEGKCIVDETEKGWYIQWIDRDPKKLAREREIQRSRQAEVDHDERMRKFIQAQIQLSAQSDKRGTHDDLSTEELAFQRRRGEPPIKIALSTTTSSSSSAVGKSKSNTSTSIPGFTGGAHEKTKVPPEKRGKKRSSVIETLMQEQPISHHRSKVSKVVSQREAHWIRRDLIVKIMNRTLMDGKLYREKGRIVKVIDQFGAQIEVGKVVVELDQDDLETVLPSIARVVQIVNGRGRGQLATLLALDVPNYCATVKLEHTGQVLENVQYEDICKVHQA